MLPKLKGISPWLNSYHHGFMNCDVTCIHFVWGKISTPDRKTPKYKLIPLTNGAVFVVILIAEEWKTRILPN